MTNIYGEYEGQPQYIRLNNIQSTERRWYTDTGEDRSLIHIEQERNPYINPLHHQKHNITIDTPGLRRTHVTIESALLDSGEIGEITRNLSASIGRIAFRRRNRELSEKDDEIIIR